MFDTSILCDKFCVDIMENKIAVRDNFIEVIEFLKNTPEYSFDVLSSIVAVDLVDKIELIYQLYSTQTQQMCQVSYYCENFIAQSIVSVYKSAYFEECEIFDMFGVKFENNNNLKRLYMPESWIGHPMLKSYKLSDERLAWNE